jgi:hypothetical protein
MCVRWGAEGRGRGHTRTGRLSNFISFGSHIFRMDLSVFKKRPAVLHLQMDRRARPVFRFRQNKRLTKVDIAAIFGKNNCLNKHRKTLGRIRDVQAIVRQICGTFYTRADLRTSKFVWEIKESPNMLCKKNGLYSPFWFCTFPSLTHKWRFRSPRMCRKHFQNIVIIRHNFKGTGSKGLAYSPSYCAGTNLTLCNAITQYRTQKMSLTQYRTQNMSLSMADNTCSVSTLIFSFVAILQDMEYVEVWQQHV